MAGAIVGGGELVVLLVVLRMVASLLTLSDGGAPGRDPDPVKPERSQPDGTTPDPQPPARPRTSGRSQLARLLARTFPFVAVALVLTAVALWIVGARRPELLPEGDGGGGQLALGLLLLGLSLTAVWVLWRVPQWQATAWAEQAGANPRERFEIENASRATLGQILSGVAVLAGLIFAWQQLGSTMRSVQLSEQGQITDRFTRAVEQLGSENVSARLGGIYALEQIARDSERDYLPAMEVLADFIRETGFEQQGDGTPALAGRPRRETVAAVRVIARRSSEQMELQARQAIPCIDLSGVNLIQLTLSEGANFDAVCLNDADLSGSVLPGATFARSDLSDARFWSSRLEGTEFVDTEMSGSDLEASDLTDARFVNVVMSEANLAGANLVGTTLQTSQLLGATLAGARLFEATFPGSDLTAVDLTGALFTGSDLSGALGVSAAQLDLAELDSATLLPIGVAATPDF